MRNPALSRVVRGLSSRTSTAAIIAGLVLVAPISNAISAGYSGNAIGSTAGVFASSSSVTFNSSIAGTDHGVVTWTPADDATNPGAPIDFLPAGQTVNYFGSGGPYTILNRIVSTDTSRPVALNGTVNSYLGSSTSGPNGGSIWFYAPGGIFVGGGAVFNVGSLLLTASDPGSTNAFISGGTFSLAQANNGSKVVISAGAQINASSQSGSYVALIAPSVQQSGTVTVNGSAAYVAARAADITINQGLFDISVTMPTEEVGPQLIHDGSTGMTFGSTESPGAADVHRIYLVAVPKNDAITMLIQGGSNLGFDIAGGATVQGSAIILSAGRNITENTQAAQQADPNTIFDFNATPTAARASIAINTGTFRSAVTGSATRNAIVSNGGNAVSINFASDLTLIAPNLVSVGSATSGQSVSIGGNVLLDASVKATTDGSPVTAGTAQLFATGGGGITVGGTAHIVATATGNGAAVTMGVPVSATGGIAQIESFGGAIDITGSTSLEANAFSGISSSAPATSLVLTAGQVNVQASGSGASLHFHDTLDASATNSLVTAPLGYDVMGNAVAGTSGQGGTVTLQNSGGGALTVDGFATLNADGYGQTVQYGPVGGAGTGGQINVNATDGALTLADGLEAFARGFGGDVQNTTSSGGLGTGGQITIGSTNATGSLTIGQMGSESILNVSARAQGGSFGVMGGNGVGGQVHLVTTGGTTHSFVPASLDASGSGGNGVTSGNGTGGFVEINGASGAITLDATADLSASASSGGAGNSQTLTPQTGNAIGGTAQIITTGTGQITINSDVAAYLSASAPGDVSARAGGNSTGGTFNIFANGTGAIHLLGNVTGNLGGSGGANELLTGAAGNGTGGNMGIDARNSSTLTIDGTVQGNSNGSGGDALQAGVGGTGTGGILLAGGGSGTLTITSLSYNSDSTGGNGLTGGGAGMGGQSTIQAFSGNLTIKNGLDLSANGRGGDADPSQSTATGTRATGGAGTGGTAYVDAMGGNIAIGSAAATDSHIAINASGMGGNGFDGGIGTGGDPEIIAKGSTVTFTPSSTANMGRSYVVALTGSGTGGNGGTGSDGSAGVGGAGVADLGPAIFALNALPTGPGSTVTLNSSVYLFGSGQGGAGGDAQTGTGGAGGAGTGAQPLVNAQSGNGHITTGDLIVDASGFGGDGGSGTVGGVGGAGTGGFAQVGVYSGAASAITNGTGSFGAYTGYAYGEGGAGGSGSVTGGAGGAGRGGFSSIVSRGGTVTSPSVSFYSDGIGGDGGGNQSENVQSDGAGGAGRGGGFGVLSTPRFQTTTVGSLTVAGNIAGSASGIGGSGSTTGSTAVGDFQIQALGGALSANSVSINVTGSTVPTDTPAGEISAVGTGLITVTNGINIASGGDVGLYFDQGGTLNAASAVISARSVTPFGEQDTAAPTGTGIFHANSFTFNILQDFRTTASFTTPGDFTLAAPGAIQTGTINAGGSIYLNFDSTAMATLHGASVSTGDLTAGGNVVVRADGATLVGVVNAGLGINLNFDSTTGATHGTGLTTGNLISGRTALLQTDGNAAIGSVTARDSLISISTGTTSIGNISAGRGAALAATTQGYVANVFAAGGSTIGSVTAKGEVRFGSLNGSISAGDIVTDRDLIVLAKQDVSLGAITTATVSTVSGQPTNQAVNPGGIYIGRATGTSSPAAQTFQADPVRTDGSITIKGPVTTGIFLAAAGTSFTATSINAADRIAIDAGGAVAINAITSRFDTDIDSDGSITLGSLDTGGDSDIEGAGVVTVASATAGRVAFADNPPSGNTGTAAVGIASSDNGPSVVLVGDAGVSLGSASAAGSIGLVSKANVTAGTLVSDESVVALVGGNVGLGPVTTGGGANGLYIANSSLYPLVKDTDGDAVAILFAQNPAPRTGGSISLGTVSAGRLLASSGGAFTTSSIIAASDITIDSGGLLSVNGAVSAPTMTIAALDIAIGTMASLGGASTTSLKLTSNATDTTIGGSMTGGQTGQATTYMLDNAEFARLRAGQIDVAASGNVTLGTLNITGSGSASGNLVGSNARFQVQTPGSIRVVGSVNLASAGATDTLGFIAGQRFEIVTDTGQVQLLGTDGKVGGIAAITAANVAVGQSALLNQLQMDPKFAGRDLLLASAPLTGGKLDGYLQAGKMAFTIGNTLLIQNSGTGSTLAGFTVGTGGIKIASSGTTPIDVVIYGQALDATGTAIPTSSIGSVVTASQTTSTANVDGCAFASGVCSPVNAGATVQTVAQTQLASISSSIQSAVTGSVGAPGGATGTSNTAPPSSSSSSSSSSSASDDDEEGSGSKSSSGGKSAAAAKPNVLIDTSSIGQTANTQIDTPVTSSGNTSLWSGEDGLAGVTGTNP